MKAERLVWAPVFALIALIALVALHGAAQARAQGSDAIDAYLSRVVAETDVPGVVAMVVDADAVLYTGAFGLQDVANDRPMTPDTIFRIASMTKPVTSVAVQMLVEEGAVHLDDPVARYLPAYADMRVFEDFDPVTGEYTSRPAASQITIRQLLTHSSGIGYAFSSERLAKLEDLGVEVTPGATPLLFDPGTRWAYGGSTRVLGQLVEAVSGRPLDEFLSERIFGPLGMTDTGYVVPEPNTRRVATIHRRGEQGLVESPNPAEIASPVRGDGGLSSTAGDYSRFIQMFLDDGRGPDGRALLSPQSVREMSRPQTGDVFVELQPAAIPSWTRPFPLGAGRDRYGLGFQVTGEPAEDDRRTPGSLSWAGIFNTQFWIDPERGIGAVLLMQYLPFYDEAAIEALQRFEAVVYQTF